ncbi:unnamed protein product [Urochloa humidicola]
METWAGIERHLVPRLTSMAQAELQTVNAILHATSLATSEDVRSSPFLLPDGRLQTSSIYKILKAAQGDCDPHTAFVWQNNAPPRVRFFAWLLTNDRVQSRANLRRRTVIDDDSCEICHGSAETSDHIMFQCHIAKQFWQVLGFHLPAAQSVKELHQLPRPADLPPEEYKTFLLLCCWQLWKRNEAVFRCETMTLRQLLQACRDEARLWECRLPRATKSVSNAWCSFFVRAM